MSNNMSTRLSPVTPRSKLLSVRGENNHATPSHPDRMQSSATGSPKSGDWKSPRPSSLEKRPSFRKGAELQQALEELAKVKEQLSVLEKAKAQAVEELAQAKKNEEELSLKLSEASEASKRERLRAEEMEQASFTAAEDWQAELDTMKFKYESEVEELRMATQAMESLKHELLSAMVSKDEAVRLAGEAMTAAETATKRVEDLSIELKVVKESQKDSQKDSNASVGVEDLTKEMASVKERAALRVEELTTELRFTEASLAEIRATHEKLVREGVEKLSVKEAEVKDALEAMEKVRVENESLRNSFILAESIERESNMNMSSLIEGLKLELASAKEVVSNMSLAVVEAMIDVEKKTAEVEETRNALSDANSTLETVATELQQSRRNLEVSMEENASLHASIADLKLELERNQLETERRKGKENSLLLEIHALNVELGSAKKGLADALGSGVEAREQVKQLQRFLEETKEDIKRLDIEAMEARSVAEMEKQAVLVAEVQLIVFKDRLQMAMDEAEAKNRKLEEAIKEVARLQSECEELSDDARVARADAELAHLEVLSARKEAAEKAVEAESARLEACKAFAEVELTRMEIGVARVEAEVACANADVARGDAEVERAQAEEARVEALMARQEAESSRSLAKREKEAADKAWVEAEEQRNVAMKARKETEVVKSQLQALEENARIAHSEILFQKEQTEEVRSQLDVAFREANKLRAQLNKAASEVEATEVKLLDAIMELEVMKALSEKQSKEGVLELNSTHFISEELDSLKVKLKEAEERASNAKEEAAAAKCCKEETANSLKAIRADLVATKMAEATAQQERECLEREKVGMQAELQKLRMEKDQWQRYASPSDSETNFTNSVTAALPKQVEEQHKVVDVSPPLPSAPQSNQKKKALFLKVGTFLGKKKSHRTPEKEAKENHSS